MKSSWMLVAGLLFGCMGVFVKLGAAHFTHIELVLYRSFFGLLLVYPIMLQQRVSVSTQHWRQHLWRGISGSLALALFFYCITVLPLATAVTLNYTAPLFLTLLTVLVFKEKFDPRLTISISLGFFGVVLLLQPTLQHDQWLPGLLGLISGFLAGVAYINVKQLARIGEPDTRTVFYFSLIAFLGSCVWILFDTLHVITLQGLIILFGLGGSGTLAQLAMTRAYRTGKTLVVGSLAYSTIIFASLFGMLLWDETLRACEFFNLIIVMCGHRQLNSPQNRHARSINSFVTACFHEEISANLP